ncbi:MAG: TspO/MBR family protein [Phycisphaerae bacterium]
MCNSCTLGRPLQWDMETPARTKRTAILSLVLWVAVSLGAGALGSLLGGPGRDPWYRELAKPDLNPPGWVFGPVWTVLYILMGVAAWGVWRRIGRPLAKPALVLFATQLVLNAIWSGIFFGLHEIGWALVDLVALWVVLAATTVLFVRVRTWSGLLLLPYLAWVTFAGVLNYSIWMLNR